jgi:hypothetical protein
MSRDALKHEIREEEGLGACQCIGCKRPGQNARHRRQARRRLKIALKKELKDAIDRD